MRYFIDFRPTVLFCALSLVFSGSLYAEDLACQAAGGRFAKVPQAETSGLPIPPNSAVRLTADEVSGVSSQQANATGDVIVERDDQVINAEQIQYDEATHKAISPQAFKLRNSIANIVGDSLDYDLSTEQGKAERVRFEYDGSSLDDYHRISRFQGTAQNMQMFGKNYYRLNNVAVNTCDAGDDSWYIEASELDADREKNIGVARNARLVFKGVPILYSPWFDFPLNGGRKSGFLSPTFGGGTEGFEAAIPYYFNLAPNYDATLTPHYYSRRGVAWGGDARYLFENFSGKLSGEWLPNDRLAKKDRRVTHFQHNHNLSGSLKMGVDYHQAADNNHYRDLGGRLDSAENVNLNRQVWLSHNGRLLGGAMNSTLNVQRYQTLQDEHHTLIEPYRLLPQLSTQWTNNINRAKVSVFGQLTRFEHRTLQEGTREVLYPSVRFDFSNQWGFIRPKMGVHATAYQLDAYQNIAKHSTTRVLPIFSVDSGITLERQGKKLTQTLEPRLFYTYIPTREQNHLPNFDSSENTFTYEQLFRENRFSGNDRINAANQISTAIATRFYENNTGKERFAAGLGQRFYLKHDDVDLSGSIKFRQENRSDFVAFLGGHITDKWYIQGNWHYNEKQRTSESYSTAVLYRHADDKRLSLRFGFDRNSVWYSGDERDELKYIDAGIQWPIYKGLSVIARQNYSLTHNKALDSLAGFQYNAKCGCWNVKAVAQRYVTDYDKTKNAFFLQLQFRGLGGLGSSADEELRRAIPGYHITDKE